MDAEKLVTRPGWETAEELGLVYYGDSNPFDNGAWISRDAIKTWQEDGYADCVRITGMCEGPEWIVERLTINKPDDWRKLDEIREACGSTGLPGTAQDYADIFACLYWGAYDPDHSDWSERQSEAFSLEEAHPWGWGESTVVESEEALAGILLQSWLNKL